MKTAEQILIDVVRGDAVRRLLDDDHQFHSAKSIGSIGYAFTSAMQWQRYKDQRGMYDFPGARYRPFIALLVDWNWRW
jgi:hypothetical protein